MKLKKFLIEITCVGSCKASTQRMLKYHSDKVLFDNTDIKKEIKTERPMYNVKEEVVASAAPDKN